MRLDKFLKVSRIIKRRSVAKEIADQGRILINNRPAKSSSQVVAGDTLTIKFGNKTETVKVNQIVETTTPRIVYFGFAMPPDMCKAFADENY